MSHGERPSSSLAFPAARDADSHLLSDIKHRWAAGESPDAQRALEEHPEIIDRKSWVLDLAYEEYCLRIESGEEFDSEMFCERFRPFQRSLRRLLEVHEYLAQHPELADAARWPQVGDTLLGFTLEEELGRGAFARVFLARETAVGDRQVVVKLSRQGKREAHTLGKLVHPAIAEVYSVQEDQVTGLTVLCMPYHGRGPWWM